MVYPIWIAIQIMALAATVAAGYYIIKQKASFAQRLLLLLSVCTFLSVYSYLRILMSKSEGEGIAFFIVWQLAMAFIGFMFVVFTINYVGRRVYKQYYFIMLANSFAIAVSCNMPNLLGWYCRDMTYHNDGFFPYVSFTPGWLYYVDLVISIFGSMYVIYLAAVTLKACDEKSERNRVRGLLHILILVTFGYTSSELFLPPSFNIFPAFTALGLGIFITLIRKYGMINILQTIRETAFDSLPEAVIVVDEKRQIVDFNESITRVFPELVPCKGGAVPVQYGFLVANPDEKLDFKHNGRHFERHMTPVYHRGKLRGHCIVLTDVTHNHQMLIQMRKLKKQADAANDSKSAFLANMSHEIRTPMNAIVGYSELLLKEKLPAGSANYARTIRSSANSLLHIINDILDFSKLEQGRLEIVEEEYVTEQLFSEVSDIVSLQAAKKGLKYVITVSPDIPAVLFGDRLRLRQVLINIISNAVKFTHEGSVRVFVEWEEEPNDHAGITVIVSDTGIGIRQNELERLFREFEQADVHKTLGTEGTGLGLSISKSLLSLMGGAIEIQSEYGVGTSVIITYSQKVVNRSPMSVFESGCGPEAAGRMIAADARVLVVDDNKVNLELMNNCLKQYRISADLVDNGADSVRKAAENNYDIIFMDQMMPGTDGITAMKQIRALGGRNEKLPIIAVTANAIVGTRNMLIGEGFTDYLSKPVPIVALESILTRYIPEGTRMLVADEVNNASEHVQDDIPSSLGLPDYIDEQTGLLNSGGDMLQFIEAVRIVCKYVPERLAALEKMLRVKDYEDYIIEIHALKSNAATIGAMELSGRAKELETAGREGRFEDIEADNGKIIEDYRVFLNDLEKALFTYDNRYSEMLSAGADEYVETFLQIADCIDANRMSAANDLFEVLDFFDMPVQVRSRVEKMKDLARKEEWGKIRDMLKNECINE